MSVAISFWRELAACDYRSKDEDSFLPTLNEAAKRVPRPNACYVGGIWLLPCDQHDVAERIRVKSRHCAQVLSQYGALP
jgi:hypothetical protein